MPEIGEGDAGQIGERVLDSDTGGAGGGTSLPHGELVFDVLPCDAHGATGGTGDRHRRRGRARSRSATGDPHRGRALARAGGDGASPGEGDANEGDPCQGGRVPHRELVLALAGEL
ncbi:hypothetical protein WME75_32290 [Sorangium sp. So ce1014]|uniref:hypothetical protein n=1 Tax=Sorangium sp. So ce1014 TaxID=3133326 RepID=UPI003F5FFA5B